LPALAAWQWMEGRTALLHIRGRSER